MNVVCPETQVYKVNVDPRDLSDLREKPETQVALDAMVHKDLKVNPDLLELLVSQEKADLWEAPALMVNQVLLDDPESKVSLVIPDQLEEPDQWVYPDLSDLKDHLVAMEPEERKETLDHPDPLVWLVPVVSLESQDQWDPTDLVDL